MWFGYNPQIILSYNPQLKVYHFSSIFSLQCYQYLINVYIYVVPLSANAHSFIEFVMKHLYVLMSWPEDMGLNERVLLSTQNTCLN